ncbi:hypothetical protein HMPREF0322_02210 [Desulfitobacterium hafniense DP7]|uniref:ABC-2 type transporter n=1 Tax=Desulfitobacterium hafniense DP7 TaxID=537010 RepID=G9XMM2_DESHA|nr:ABC transporter permease [Desulfitobacterium hafniense]EHL07052.1 hypothetical protein HMPREF0322_02210 [Desulfitobacterium hafniense DP7]
MRKALSVEFRKTRHRRIWLIVAALLGFQLLWFFWGLKHMDAGKLQQGWLLCLYQFPVLNAIILPVVTAVVASRLSDVEHKGQTFRLLNTVMPAGKLFDAKFLCGAFYILAIVILQVMAMLLAGYAKGFTESPPLPQLGYYLLFTSWVTLTLLLIQHIVSLLSTNQMIPLSLGLLGGFAGLFIMYLPPQFARLIPWGYYGVLMQVGMNWDRETRITDFYWTDIDWPGFLIITAAFLLFYSGGRALFRRKEV